MRLLRSAAFVLGGLLPSLATAQIAGQITAHPQDTILNSNGNLSPFGCLSATSNFIEGRAQILIRELELPGPGAVLLGMEVHCQGSLTLTYSRLDISVSPSFATSLSTTFANNLLAPQPVLQEVNHPIAWTSGAWTQIPFTNPYVHNGITALVIDIQKVIDPTTAAFATMDTTSNPVRTDLPPMLYQFGPVGSGMANAATGNQASPLSIRLLWIDAPTLHLRADRSSSAPNNQYALGTTIQHTVDGLPGALVVNFMGVSFLPQFLVVPPILGEWRMQGETIDVAILPASGSYTRPLPIPAGFLGLVGVHFAYQSATLDPVTSTAQFTNATDHVVNR